ncbi:MAG TPA: hypothetical protein DD670_12870 [Planctomycetaceae bacterium]|nr:hypothetical protein [Planctomycetaceae bacterium]
MMQYTGYLLILVFVSLLTAVGQLLFKKTAVKRKSLQRKLADPCFIFGCMAFFAGPPLSVLAATKVEFSVLYTMTALNYVFVLILSHTFLKETMDMRKCAGVAIVVTGLIVFGVGCTVRTPTSPIEPMGRKASDMSETTGTATPSVSVTSDGLT